MDGNKPPIFQLSSHTSSAPGLGVLAPFVALLVITQLCHNPLVLCAALGPQRAQRGRRHAHGAEGAKELLRRLGLTSSERKVRTMTKGRSQSKSGRHRLTQVAAPRRAIDLLDIHQSAVRHQYRPAVAQRPLGKGRARRRPRQSREPCRKICLESL